MQPSSQHSSTALKLLLVRRCGDKNWLALFFLNNTSLGAMKIEKKQVKYGYRGSKHRYAKGIWRADGQVTQRF